jgi:hypothetical protein
MGIRILSLFLVSCYLWIFKKSNLIIKSYYELGKSSNDCNLSWVKRLRMQGHHLPATLEVIGSNPDPGKIKLIKIEKNHQQDSRLKLSPPLYEEKKNV